jgi:hypothetical protein
MELSDNSLNIHPGRMELSDNSLNIHPGMMELSDNSLTLYLSPHNHKYLVIIPARRVSIFMVTYNKRGKGN